MEDMDCCLALPRRENTETGSSLSETVAFNARPLIYASGNFGKNILWGTTEITLLFVMTDMLELSPSLAGLILLGSLVVDGVLDPCVGFLADRLHTPIGRYGPLILIGAPLSALSFFALYTLPLVGAGSACLITFLVVAFRASYSLIDLPHNALMTHVTRQSEARGRLAGYRFLFSSLASFILALSLAPLIQNGGGEILSPRGLAVFAGSVACLSAIVMVASWSVVREKDRESARAVRFRAPLMKGVRALWASPSYRIALVVGCLATFSLPLFGKSLLYISTYLLDRPEAASSMLTAMVLGQFAGLPLWIFLSGQWEKRQALQLAHATTAAGFVGLCASLFAWPYAMIGFCIVVGVGASGVYTIIWGMVTDCVEEVKDRSGVNPEGMLFAFAILGQKASIALGVGGFALALDLSGYAAGQDISGSPEIVLIGFGLLIPMAGSISCVLLLRHYQLNHARHREIVRRLYDPT